MKKTFVTMMFLIALSFAPGSLYADELTKAEVITLKPQLINLMTSLNLYVTGVQMRLSAENDLMRQLQVTLGSLSSRLGRTPAPTDLELRGISITLLETQRLLSKSLLWREEVKISTSNTIRILSNIKGMITTAI